MIIDVPVQGANGATTTSVVVQSQAQTQGLAAQWTNSAIAGGQLIALCVSVVWVRRQWGTLKAQVKAAEDLIGATKDQMLATLEWNKRAKAFSALEKHKDNITYRQAIREIEKETLEKGGTVNRAKLFKENAAYKTARLTILNDLEALALEITHKMCDEDIAYDLLRDIVMTQWEEMSEIILQSRKDEGKFKKLICLENLYIQWKHRYDKEILEREHVQRDVLMPTPKPHILARALCSD
ncbi:MAG TPA: DUF4760 domain-containing protein [Geothrix sp.]|nr:DUF4760 domain-containing protein [Geothrix sp.]